jgi:flagellar assembly protein FliH
VARVVRADSPSANPRRIRELWGSADPASAGTPRALPAETDASRGALAPPATGVPEAEAELQRLRGLVRDLVEQVAAARCRLEQDAQRQAVDLATAMAQRILRRELRTEPELVQALVSAAVEGVDTRSVVRLRVHPEVAALLRGAPDMVFDETDGAPELIGDASLEPGDCVIETSVDLIDARVATQLTQLKEAAERAL